MSAEIGIVFSRRHCHPSRRGRDSLVKEIVWVLDGVDPQSDEFYEEVIKSLPCSFCELRDALLEHGAA